ncbi:MAG: hypothetical protein AB1649_08410 [Chloroflexota bacterium]
MNSNATVSFLSMVAYAAIFAIVSTRPDLGLQAGYAGLGISFFVVFLKLLIMFNQQRGPTVGEVFSLLVFIGIAIAVAAWYWPTLSVTMPASEPTPSGLLSG